VLVASLAPAADVAKYAADLGVEALLMQGFLQQVVGGIANGGIFASLALALVLIYNAMGLVNFAQGEMAMFATFMAFTLLGHGVNYWIALPVTLVIAFVGGLAVQRIVIRPVERAPVLTLVIVTLGLATLLNGLAGFIWGYLPQAFPSPFSAVTTNVLGVFVSYQNLGVIAVSAVVLFAIYLLLQRTTVGLTMRAAAHNPEASRLLGVNASWMLALGWGLASAVGAVSGIMTAPILFLEPNMMQTVIIYAFAAAVLGGIESPLGAVVGGLIVGVTVNLAGTYIRGVGGDLQLAVALAIIVAALVVKPNGLFGRPSVRRV
jgi:branched-chain amino acid transport system permease protein